LLGTHPQIRADVGYLTIAVQNVFANEVEYANEGGWIKIETHRASDEVVFTLANSGSCISQADAENVFNRLWRGDKARTHVGLHFGLGLSLVKRSILAMGGEVQVKTEIGREFSISLKFPTMARLQQKDPSRSLDSPLRVG
jgi:two-component system sensor histidine kinase BaeS